MLIARKGSASYARKSVLNGGSNEGRVVIGEESTRTVVGHQRAGNISRACGGEGEGCATAF